MTDAEFNALPPRYQEQVKRIALHNAQPAGGWSAYYSPAVHPGRYKRVGMLFYFLNNVYCVLIVIVDWLRERVFFEGLKKHDTYAVSRLGFRAPNIFIMDLVA